MRGQNIYRLIPALSVLSLWACVFIGPELNLTCWHSEFLSPCLASGPCNIIFLHPSSVCLHHFQMFFSNINTHPLDSDGRGEGNASLRCRVILESPVLGSAMALVVLLLLAALSRCSSDDLSRPPSAAALSGNLAFCLVPQELGSHFPERFPPGFDKLPYFWALHILKSCGQGAGFLFRCGTMAPLYLGRFSCRTNRTRNMYVPHL